MRIVFMGSGHLACPAVRAVLESPRDELVAVVTQPDRPSGRNRLLTACPVKAMVAARGVPLLTPEDVNAPDVRARLEELKPDLAVVADFGQFLKPPVLAIPPKGLINIHPSLLPRYRGAAPVQWAVANGDTATGVTILYVTEKMDAGDIILQEQVPIRDDATSATLEPLLAELGATLLLRALDQIREGRVRAVPQDEARVTLAPKLKKEDGRIDWRLPARIIHNRVRGFQPWPGCFCAAPAGSGRILRVLRTRLVGGTGEPGTVIAAEDEGPVAAAGDGALVLLEVQPEGRKPMSGRDYVNGYRLSIGWRLG